jgi:hypothetical protein
MLEPTVARIAKRSGGIANSGPLLVKQGTMKSSASVISLWHPQPSSLGCTSKIGSKLGMNMPSEALSIGIRPQVVSKHQISHHMPQLQVRSTIEMLPLPPLRANHVPKVMAPQKNARIPTEKANSWTSFMDRIMPVRNKPIKLLNREILAATRTPVNQKLAPQIRDATNTAIEYVSNPTRLSDFGAGMNGGSAASFGQKAEKGATFDLHLVKREGDRRRPLPIRQISAASPAVY